mmetsp:Transcript_20330/g.63863  ORF Transcript_20330/g.63863 Transcript_20330/m.63863 type:complete len:371 (-) Transcript_20330:324-1436(-)
MTTPAAPKATWLRKLRSGRPAPKSATRGGRADLLKVGPRRAWASVRAVASGEVGSLSRAKWSARSRSARSRLSRARSALAVGKEKAARTSEAVLATSRRSTESAGSATTKAAAAARRREASRVVERGASLTVRKKAQRCSAASACSVGGLEAWISVASKVWSLPQCREIARIASSFHSRRLLSAVSDGRNGAIDASCAADTEGGRCSDTKSATPHTRSSMYRTGEAFAETSRCFSSVHERPTALRPSALTSSEGNSNDSTSDLASMRKTSSPTRSMVTRRSFVAISARAVRPSGVVSRSPLACTSRSSGHRATASSEAFVSSETCTRLTDRSFVAICASRITPASVARLLLHPVASSLNDCNSRQLDAIA